MPGAYYNEFDPYAAQWLRNLIAEGHIAPGVVDERSILDVSPDDLIGYTQCHFFAGVGVWSYALRRAGWGDDRPVWTGSCPCQPFSVAGVGGGFDDERHVWPFFAHLIEQRRPVAIVGEQVASKNADAWLDLVQDDLEGMGYAFGAVAFPSASIGAPHIRDRTYWVAHSSSTGLGKCVSHPRVFDGQVAGQTRQATIRGSIHDVEWLADLHTASAARHGTNSGPRETQARVRGGSANSGESGRVADDVQQHRGWELGARGWFEPTELCLACGLAYSNGAGFCQGCEGCEAAGHGQAFGADCSACGLAHSDGGNTCSEWQQRGGEHGQQSSDNGPVRMEHTTGDGRQQRRAESGGRGVVRRREPNELVILDEGVWTGPTNGFWRDADWLGCRDGKWRPVEPGTFPLAHGAAARVGRLRAYGNAVNAEQARIFIEVVMEGMP